MISISGAAADRGDERALDLRAGGVAAGVGDAVAVVAALAGQRQLAVGHVVEVGAEGDQLAHGLGALAYQRPDGVQVAGTGPGDQGVDLVLVGGVTRAERGGDAALGPLGRAGVEPSLVTTRTFAPVGSVSLRRSAAVSPAMPEPMTTTSAVVVQPGSEAVSRPGSRRTRRGHRSNLVGTGATRP